MLHCQRNAGDPRGDHGQSAGHRLEDDVRQPVDVALLVVHRRQHEEVGGAVEVRESVAQHRARQVHPRPPGLGRRGQLGQQVAVACQDHVQPDKDGCHIDRKTSHPGDRLVIV